jgi:enoyl-CoA hydratase/carnithine racemase
MSGSLKPMIAAVNGPAAGGGLALALACDIRIAAPEARFNVAFVRLGLSGADVGVSWLLPRVVGLGHASEMMLTGRLVEADEALRIGLVNSVAESNDALIDTCLEKAAEIARNSPFGLRLTKQVLELAMDAPSLEAAIALENRNQVLASRTEDMGEAVAAFLQKRDPDFHNR